MTQSMRSMGLMLVVAGMASLGHTNHAATQGEHSVPGTPYTPPPADPEQIAELMKGNNAGQLHRFVIQGREIWARNKKAALRKANSL